MNLYKELWSRIGGRPWTYIIRDIWDETEWLMQGMWFFMGIFVGIYFDWRLALIAWAVYTFGYVNGHLFWGTSKLRGQKGK